MTACFSHPQPSDYAPSSLSSHSHHRTLSSSYGHTALPPFSHSASQYELVKLEDDQYTVSLHALSLRTRDLSSFDYLPTVHRPRTTLLPLPTLATIRRHYTRVMEGRPSRIGNTRQSAEGMPHKTLCGPSWAPLPQHHLAVLHVPSPIFAFALSCLSCCRCSTSYFMPGSEYVS